MHKPDFLKVDFDRQKAKGGLRVYEFMDNGHFVSYIPSLNLSAYADTAEESTKRLFEVVLNDFFDALTSLPEYKVSEELKKLGWNRGSILRKKFEQTVFVDRDGILKNFNLSEETVINDKLVAV